MSTAMAPPKWWTHNGSWFIDKNGVVNGFRIEPFIPGSLCQGLPPDQFLQMYYNQLMALDFDAMMRRFEEFAERYKRDFGVEGEVTFALLVHEAPYNPYSERGAIQKWFETHGVECKEFTRR